MRGLIFTVLSCLALATTPLSAQEKKAREADFNFGWKFALLNEVKSAESFPLNDSDWRTVNLPHDWSVEAEFSPDLEGATGYLPGGIGVYQKRFATPADIDANSVFVLFDGVYNNATFFLNGAILGANPYGYSPTYFDLTKHLTRDNSDNVLSVYVDRTRYADSRWYTGSGIYRNVSLITVNKLHVPIWGTFVKTPQVSQAEATVDIEVTVRNDRANSEAMTVVTEIQSPDGKTVATMLSETKVATGVTAKLRQSERVTNPRLWSTNSPALYQAVTRVLQSGKVVDEVTTRFGIRSIEFRAREGFFLNGEPILMKGVSLHHDGGLVGVAVPKEVWRRRLETLKEAGVNAVRTAHNPFSKEFLELCDEMGLLVQNEIFDEFDYPKDKRLNFHDRHDDYITRGYSEHFQEWSESDLKRTVLRDRNHPSVVQWSIGNEIEWAYISHRFATGFWPNPDDPMEMDMSFWSVGPKFAPEEIKARYDALPKGKYDIAETAHKLSGWVRELDTTRPVTANMVLPQVSHVSGYADAVDVVGYSYRNPVIPWGIEHFPDKPISIHENPGTWSDWQAVLDNPGVYSIFMWTGIDYMGERHDKWPEKSGWGDMLDLAGFKKQGWNYFKSIWVDEPHMSIGTLPLDGSGFSSGKGDGRAVANDDSSYTWRDSNMHWNYSEGTPVLVEVSTNHQRVELSLNDRPLGVRTLSDDEGRIMRWVVPFEAGRLSARAVTSEQTHTIHLETSSPPSQMNVQLDRVQLTADGIDTLHVEVRLLDEAGRVVRTDDRNIRFDLSGPVKLLGVDNGAPDNVQGFQKNSVDTHRGRALAIVQSQRVTGEAELVVSAEGLDSQKFSLTIEK